MKTLSRHSSIPYSTNGRSRKHDFADSDDKLRSVHNTGQEYKNLLSQYVIGQDDMVLAVVAALLGDVKVCLVGKSGVGKTYAAETLMKMLGIKSQLVPLNPDVTCSDITGWMSFDHETSRKVYWPSPFVNGTHMVVLDELNRSSDKVQASLLDILNGNRVIVDQTQYDVSDILTTIMTMNPPEDPGTRPIIDALADRIDFTLMVQTPKPASMRQIIAHNLTDTPVKKIFDAQSAQVRDPETGQLVDIGEIDSERVVRDIRKVTKHLMRRLSSTIPEIASEIVNGFQSDEWATPATVRTGISIVKMATIVAAVEHGSFPKASHVWQVAPGCLGMLKTTDWTTTSERTYRIWQRVQEIKAQYEKKLH